jgi:hypothetical protein
VKRKLPSIRTRLRLISATILMIGFGSAISIYLTVDSAPGNPLGYEPEDSRQYLREMEIYGGKANVLASELRRWFNGLWHGKRLTLTVACITALLASAFWLVAAQLPSDDEAGASSEHKGGGPDS